MKISEGTKISELIKYNPGAIEVIASINHHFEKLRNPILRKVLASRVTITDAAKIGKCHVDVFFEKLAEIGFVRDLGIKSSGVEVSSTFSLPGNAKVIALDVTTDIANGKDPFLKILGALDNINVGEFLAVINSFEPTPLISILNKKSYPCLVEHKNNMVYTYISKLAISKPLHGGIKSQGDSLDKELTAFGDRLKVLDVSKLEMPGPMMAILNELEHLPVNNALHVYHRRVPQLLLPELKERGINILIKEIDESSVELLIYK